MKFINKKYKKITALCILIILTAFVLMLTAAAKNNIASGGKIDSFCGESGDGKSAIMLIDGDPSYETKWEASDGANHKGEPHWIVLDLGTEKTFDSVKLIKASQGSDDFGRVEFDASGLKIEVSSDKIKWVIINEVTENEDDIYECGFTPVTARYLKLTITHPEQDDKSDENQTVRLYDLKVFEYSAPIEYEDEDISETEPADLSEEIIVAPKTYDCFYLPFLCILFFVIIFISRNLYCNKKI